jgi:hypothetical protein
LTAYAMALGDTPRALQTAPTATKRSARKRAVKRARLPRAETAPATATPIADDDSYTRQRYFQAVKRLGVNSLARHILERAVSYAARAGRTPKAPPLLDYFALLCGTLSSGRDSKSRRFSPTLLFDWLVEEASQSRVEEFLRSRLTSQPSTPNPDVAPSAYAVVERAEAFARDSHISELFSARHIIAAMVTDVDLAIRRQLKQELGVDITDFRFRLLDYVKSERPDEAEFWERVLTGNIFTNLFTISGFNSDAPSTVHSDPLGIRADVEAFARLICFDQTPPPLSIGLFGDWGSGKSTFMESLQREIASLAASQPSDVSRTAAENAPRFVKNIVQIRFNAWHFADANLWASLTAVFFDQLRRGGHGHEKSADYQDLIGKVADRVRSLEAGAQHAEKTFEEAQHKSEAAQKALDTAQTQLAASDFAVASEQIQKGLKSISDDNKETLQKVGKMVYGDDLSDLKAFTAAAIDASTIPGKVALVARVLMAGNWATYLAVGAVIVVAVFGIGSDAIDATNYVPLWTQKLLAWCSGSLAAMLALGHCLKIAKPILDGAWNYAKVIEEAREKLTKEIRDKRQEAAEAASSMAIAELQLKAARSNLLAYGQGADAGAPGTILRYFLFEDGDVRDYDKQVGIISRARRSFEQLDAIVKSARKGDLSAPEGTTVAKFPVPDRIVLYIDDLDRCTHDQVYAVLQAIHLLLFFELFVVVVGVDFQWIEGAITKHFEAGLDGPEAKEKPELTRRKRAIDYLEKIFQIPFWLRRLTTTNDDGSTTEGPYGRYVRELLKDNARIEPAPVPEPNPRPEPGAEPGHDPEPGPPRPPINDDSSNNEDSSNEIALESMRLEDEEIEFLASRVIGTVASKSPRAVKRLINVYRIVRARLDASELEAFLGRNGKVPLYPIAALMVAVETGQPVEIADTLFTTVKSLDPSDRLGGAWIPPERAEGLGEAISSVEQLCRPTGATVENYLKMARIVRRYSFNQSF